MALAALWAVSAWPAINFMSRNWQAVARGGSRGLAGVALVVLASGLAGHLFYWLVRHKPAARAVVTLWVVLICLGFGYGAIHDGLARAFESSGVVMFPPSVVWGVLLVLSVAAVIVWRRHSVLHDVATMFALVAPALALLTLAGAVMRSRSALAEPSAGEGGKPSSAAVFHGGAHPNVYYFILDAYAGRRALHEFFGFDNGPFLDRMRSLGFHDVTAERSNYVLTPLTVGAILSLGYPKTEDPATWGDASKLWPEVLDQPEPPPFIEHLARQGYQAWYAGSVWSGCPPNHVHCLGDAARVEPDYLTQAYLASTPLSGPLMRLVGMHRDALASVETHLRRLLALRSPHFVFIHHLSPHPPYFLDADCAPRGDEIDDWTSWDPAALGAYVEAVICVNRRTLPIVEEIVRTDPGAVIVVQGDHGSAFHVDWSAPLSMWSADAIDERTSHLNLVRFPDACAPWSRARMGQVNTARFVVACVEGTSPDYLPERTYLSTYEGPERDGVKLLATAGAAH